MEGEPEGGVRLRRFLGESALYGLGSVADKAVGFLLLPITTALLHPADFGLLNLFGTNATLLFIFVSMGLHQAVAVFNAKVPTSEGRRRVFAISLWSVVVVSSVATLVLTLLSGVLSDWLFAPGFAAMVVILGPTTFLQFVRQIGFSRLRLQQRPVTFVIVMFFSTLVIRGVALTLICLNAESYGWVIGEYVGLFITAVVLWPLVLSDLRPVRDEALSKELLTYGLALTPAIFAQWLMVAADKYVMKAMLPNPLEAIGYYSVGERVSTVIHLVNIAFVLGWQRFAFENLQREEGAERVARGLTLYAALGGYAALGLALLGDDLTHWVMPSKYNQGMAVIPALTLAGFLSGFSELVSVGLQQTGRAGRLSFLNGLAAALQIALLILLIRPLGILGAAYANLGCQLLKTILVWQAAQSAMPIPWEYRRLALLAAAFAAIFAGGQLLTSNGWVFQTCSQTLLVLCVPFVLFAAGFLHEDERERLAAAAAKIRRSLAFG